jgi:hypothetical protein
MLPRNLLFERALPMKTYLKIASVAITTLCLIVITTDADAQRKVRRVAAAAVQSIQDFTAWDAAYDQVGSDGDSYKAANADRVSKEATRDDAAAALVAAEADLAAAVAAEQAAYDTLVASVDTLSTETVNIAPVAE